ncbi:MAG: DUF6351 family protein, partial [Chitinophagaceae bacterium]
GYQILMPKVWNKKLVMWAHGYQFAGTDPQSGNADLNKRMELFLERGFAIAASDYPIQGFALAQGVDATEELRIKFIEKYGKPDSTFMVGGSMGGGVTVAMIENYSQNYYGGLALCPLSSKVYLQFKKEFDIYATFNGLFPGIVPSLKEIFDVHNHFKPIGFAEAGSKMMEIRKAILAKDSVLALAFAKRFDLKLDDLPGSLFFNQHVLRDLALKTNGNPIDNTQTMYTGFPDDILVNTVAERLPANVSFQKVFGKYERSGDINKPVLILHTKYDQLIPPSYAVTNFENMVHSKGKDKFLAVKYTDGQGHCAFTPEQTIIAFDALRHWVSTNQKPSAIEYIK